MVSKKHKLPLEQRVFKYIKSNNLLIPGQKLLLAVSGGPDSVCLLHILSKLQKELQLELHVAHLDHSLRGHDAKKDAEYVMNLTNKLGIPASIEKRDVRAYQKIHRLSLEEAAREVRYAFLTEIANSVGAASVATGHTLNDQSETILLHIIRGTGTRGLRGLQPLQELHFSNRKLTVIRPLLEIEHKETVSYCKLHRLSPRTDSTNQSLDFMRNRVRHELLPILRNYNNGIVDSLARISQIAFDDLAFLESESGKVWEQVVQQQKGIFIFEKESFLSLAPALQRLLLRMAIENQVGSLKDVETRHIEEILHSLIRPAGRVVNLPYDLKFYVDYDRFLLGSHPEKLSPFPKLKGEHRVFVPGTTNLLGWCIEASVKPLSDEIVVKNNLDNFTAYLDWNKTGKTITVRPSKPGDRFQPLGMEQEKKVALFMLDARVPKLWRSNIPVFCNRRQVLWLAGFRLDERVKINCSTRQVLCLKISKTS